MDWRNFLEYEPDTGRLLWTVYRGGRCGKPGEEAGSVKHCGRYRSFVLNHKRYYTHRVVWEMVNGPIPKGMCIDHIDGNGLNNRIENLRVTTLSSNQRNRALVRTTKTGIHGVHPLNGGFSVQCAGEYIKFTKDFFEACCARKSAERRMGFHINHGRASV
jgi:hypothetical protein